MNREEFGHFVEYAFERSKKVLIKKGDEYARDENAFHVFQNATGISLHNVDTSVAWEMAVKHLQSIKDILREVEYNNLSKLSEHILDEKFGDAINYFVLIEGMLREKIKK